MTMYGPAKTKTEIMRGIPDVVKSCFVQRNTIRYTNTHGETVIRFHNTDVLVMHDNGGFELNSGGYRTTTTKERINNYIPGGWGIYSDKGVWYLTNRTKGKTVPFDDGITVGPRGGITGEGCVSKVLTLKKKVKDYCKALSTFPGLPIPGPGDCWICMMFNKDGKPNNRCLLSHLDEKYIHGTLIVNAMRWRGFDDKQISFHYQVPQLKGRVVQAVRAYLMNYLGLPR